MVDLDVFVKAASEDEPSVGAVEDGPALANVAHDRRLEASELASLGSCASGWLIAVQPPAGRLIVTQPDEVGYAGVGCASDEACLSSCSSRRCLFTRSFFAAELLARFLVMRSMAVFAGLAIAQSKKGGANLVR